MPLHLTTAIFARGDADEEEDGMGDEIVRPRRQASQRSEDPLRDPQQFRACTCRESWRALPFLPVDAYPLPLRPQSSASSSHYVHLRLRVPRRVTQDHRRLPLWPLLERCHLPSRRLPHGGRPSASYRLRMTRTRTMSRTTAMTSPRTPTMSTTPRPLRALHERPTTRRTSAFSASTGRCTS